MKFSIIIPVYNLEKYIGELLDSIISQDFFDYEVLIINDGSTDDSEKIITEKIKKYDNFHLITEKNSGPGAARNAGIKAAMGEYILFFDGDDFLTSNNALKKLDNILEKKTFDILVYPIQHSDYCSKKNILSNVKYEKILNSRNECTQIMKIMMKNGLLLSSPCEMLLSRQFIIEHQLYFPEGVFSEDIEWIIRIMKSCPRLYFIDYQFYCYRWNRPGSTCNSNQDYLKILKIIEFLNDHYKQLITVKSEMADICLSYIAYQWCVVASKIVQIPDANKKSLCWDELLKSRQVLAYCLVKKVKIFTMVSRIVGVKNAAKLGWIIYRFKRKFIV